MEPKINEIRARFEQELTLSSQPNQYHEVDIARVRTEEWQVKRYLLDAQGDVEAAYQALLRTLAWKQSFGVHTFKVEDFPREMFEAMRGEVFDSDRSGRKILTESYTYQKHFKELDTPARQLIVAQVEAVDRAVGEAGAIYIGDFTSAPLANVNIGMAKFRVDCLNQHYPLLFQKMLLVNVPFLLKPVIKLIVSFMKASIREAVENVNGEQLIQKYVDKSVLHREVGGTREKRLYPDGLKSLKEMAGQLQLSDAFLEQYYAYYNTIPL